MNTFAVIILAALLFGYLLDLLADALNLKSLRSPLPDEFRDVYDQERYDKSQSYTLTRTRFGFVTETFGLLLILAFWFAGGFNYLDQWVRSFGFGTIPTGLLFIGILSVGQSLITLPFGIYSTFVIEERFGFNKTTARTFITDLLKGLALSLALGAPLLAGVLYFFEAAGSAAWLYVWALITAFTLGVQYIAPTWIMPLFNKFEPLEEGELRTAIMAAADKAGFPLQGVFRIDGSKRSSRANAFFTGFGRNKRIALYDTLIEKHTTDELVNVLAHEIGHYKLRHIQTGMVAGIAQTGLMLALLQYFLTAEGLFDAFYMEEMSVYAGLLFFGMLYSPVSMILSIFMQMQSRRHEYQADAFAAQTTGQPEVMISALKKLSADNLSNLTPHPFYAFLNYSHPPVLQRIKALRLHPAGTAAN
jgi:STE24 endopeptidase